jgi:3-hydroxybutyryl-CoA dehydrogenase
MVREGTLLATNTSSLSLTAIGSVVPASGALHRDSLLQPRPRHEARGARGRHEDLPETIADAMEFGKKLGKDPVVSKDSPGFLVNRCLVVMLNEAICLYSEGVGTAEDIDKGMVLGCNHPMGPLTLADMVGLDIVSAVMECFYQGFADSKYRPALLLRKMVDAGMLGVKTGQGFYKYDASGKKVK